MSTVLLSALLLALAPARSSQVQGPLERRAHEVAALVRKDPKWGDDLFDKSFTKQVPPAQLAPVFEQYFGMLGAVTEVQITERKSEYSATCDLIGEKDVVAPMTITLDEQSIDPSVFAAPSHVEDVEWFASASDLCRAMDWLRRATESGKAAALRGVLAINPGLPVSTEAFPFVGYKGGSEPGVINLTFLLRAKDGTWYAATAGWNDPKAAVEDGKLTGLMQRVLYLLGKGVAAKEEGK